LDLQQHIEQEGNMDCSKRLERNGYRVNFEQESNRREYEQGIKFELRKYSNPKSYQKINSRLDNSGRYERNGHEGRYARGHRVRLWRCLIHQSSFSICCKHHHKHLDLLSAFQCFWWDNLPTATWSLRWVVLHVLNPMK
jgi:hypothetical protein